MSEIGTHKGRIPKTRPVNIYLNVGYNYYKMNQKPAMTNGAAVRAVRMAFQSLHEPAITWEDLKSRSRSKPFSNFRKMIWAILRAHTTMTLHQLGALFLRDHSTVQHNIKIFEDLFETEAVFEMTAIELNNEFKLTLKLNQ